MLRDRIRRHPAVWFVIITYAVTWSAWIPLALTGRGVTIGLSWPYLLGLFGPLVGAFATTYVTGRRTGIRDLLARMRRVHVGGVAWGFAIGVPVFVAAAVYVVTAAYSVFLLAPVELQWWDRLGQFNGFPVTNALAMWIMLVLVNGFGEETGWRGFLLPQLEQRWSRWTAGALVGVIWAGWHVPAFFVTETYRVMPVAMIPMFFVGLMCGSLFATWLYHRSRHSIAVLAIWHGTFNLFSGSAAARGTLGAVETTVVLVLAVVLIVREHRRVAPPESRKMTSFAPILR